jgi:hypothetical protein
MGVEAPFQPAMLVLGVLRSPSLPREEIEAGIEAALGPIGWRGPEFPFTWSAYYDDEMGRGLLRSFHALAELVDPASLPGLKRRTDALERAWARDGRRRANLDPGLLSLARFSLATTKDRAHRIALADGIYAELTLVYREGAFRPLPWTYPDWQSPPYLAILQGLRNQLKDRLREGKTERGD